MGDDLDIVKAAAEGGVEGFLRTIAGPVVEAGEWVADVIRRQRMRTQIKTMQLAQRMIDEAGLEATVVPAKTLVPLLDFAGLEEDEEMQDLWAALLANAAADLGDDTGAVLVLPSFPSILAELSPIEAKLLDRLASSGQWGENPVSAWLMLEGLQEDPSARVYTDNLERLMLVRIHRPDRAVHELSKAAWGSDGPPPQDLAHITSLGAAFVRACRPLGASQLYPNARRL